MFLEKMRKTMIFSRLYISYLSTLINLDQIDFLVFGPQGRVWILFWQIDDSRDQLIQTRL